MAEKDKKYYWLKLKRDFFKRHDIRIIESMPNGKDYLLFYLKLLCESVDHEGNLRFSESIPYNENMLATITDTNVDIVRSAVKVFTELGMMEVMDDGTYYMTEVNKMIGSETYWAEQKRKQRKLDNVQRLSNTSPTCPSKSQSKSIEIELDNDDLSILNKLKDEEIRNLGNLCEDSESFNQLIRYADAKISQREDDSPISNPYNYLLAVGVNEGFIKE